MLVLVYVDDIIIIGSCDNDIKHLMTYSGTHFANNDLGPLFYFLGIQVQKSKSGILLSQKKKYINDHLTKASMDKCKSILTPISLVHIF